MRSAVRTVAFTASLVAALVVAALPGTTIASQPPARLAVPTEGVPAPAAPQATPEPILVPVSLHNLVTASYPRFVPGSLSALAAEYNAITDDDPRPAPPREHLFDDAMVVSIYGHPGVCTMGDLGCHADPMDAVASARAHAADYEALSPERPVLPAFHLIVDIAQPSPGDDGQYLWHMPTEEIERWVDLARENDVLLFLDIQIGWGDIDAHVARLEPFLAEPFVHLALDPEFATRSRNAAPGAVIGTLTAEQVNVVQERLASIVRRHDLPAKALIVHQFNEDMLTAPGDFASLEEVDVTIDMDGWGPPWPKSEYYSAYALAPYAEYPAIKLFEKWDVPLMTPWDVMALPVTPSYVIYQ